MAPRTTRLRTSLAAPHRHPRAATGRRPLAALLVLHNDLEALLAALMVANAAAAQNQRVEIYFSFWGIHLLRGERRRKSANARRPTLIERLLQTDPDARPADADEVVRALDELLAEVRIDPKTPEWSLVGYLEDSEGYERRLRKHLDEALLTTAKAAFARGEHLSAQRTLNRLLVLRPDHPEVLALLTSLHQPEPTRPY